MRPATSMVGRQVGRLMVLERAGAIGRDVAWRCSCACGRIHITTSGRLNSGKAKSCGCSRRSGEAWIVHGHASHGRTRAEYRSWCGMIARCENEATPAYVNYGGRGIRVCVRWRGDYRSFFNDMGPRPDGKSLDRINNDAGYDCGRCGDCRSRGVTTANCRWATATEQGRNKRNNRFAAVVNGRRITISEASEMTGLSESAVRGRIRSGRLDVLRAGAIPRAERVRGPRRLLTVDGVTMGMTAWAKRAGSTVSLISRRLRLGWSERDAVLTPRCDTQRDKVALAEKISAAKRGVPWSPARRASEDRRWEGLVRGVKA